MMNSWAAFAAAVLPSVLMGPFPTETHFVCRCSDGQWAPGTIAILGYALRASDGCVEA